MKKEPSIQFNNNDFTIFVIVKTHSYEQKQGKATNKYLENKFAI